MILSVVIPAFNVSKTIIKALNSITSEEIIREWELEIIVVDDGGQDSDNLKEVLRGYLDVRYIAHGRNRGMCAARNSGIEASQGEFVTLLDADDEFVPGWFQGFLKIMAEWPDDASVCFTPCINDSGERTCKVPGYRGYLTAEDFITERYSGEYNPIFRGDYIRGYKYVDLGTRKSCGLLSYLKMARQQPFWVTDQVQRIYHVGTGGSVSIGWTKPEKAWETYVCFCEVLKCHGEYIKSVSRRHYSYLKYKMLIYAMFSGKGRGFSDYIKELSWSAFPLWVETGVLLILGPGISEWALKKAKKLRLLRQYG